MEMNTANVIGEGSYGCVHKPSLKCKETKIKGKRIDYSNQVSKVLINKEATKEMSEYVLIKNIDKNNDFYLGEPIHCKVNNTDDYNKRSIQKCKNGVEIQKGMSKDYSLIIMKDGGLNLADYSEKVEKLSVTPENKEKMEKFWIEGHRMIRGIKAFLNHGFIHHDMKPQNVVYNETDNRLNFIDFGLVQNKRNIIKDSKNTKYWFGRFWWSFPPEIFFLNKNIFDEMSKLENMERIRIFNNTLNEFKNPNTTDELAYALQGFIPYIESLKKKTEYYYSLQILFRDGFKEDYSEFLDKCIDTIDIYGLGFSFLYLLSKSNHLMDASLMSDLESLFFSMITPNYIDRIDIDNLLNLYEFLLKKHGLLTKYGYVFDNHILKKTGQKDSSAVSTGNIDSPLSHENAKQIDEIVNTPSIVTDKIKKMISTELTPCPDDEIMNSNRMCVKKQRITKKVMDCTKDQERNPNTGRCVKKCKRGQRRNPFFVCVGPVLSAKIRGGKRRNNTKKQRR